MVGGMRESGVYLGFVHCLGADVLVHLIHTDKGGTLYYIICTPLVVIRARARDRG